MKTKWAYNSFGIDGNDNLRSRQWDQCLNELSTMRKMKKAYNAFNIHSNCDPRSRYWKLGKLVVGRSKVLPLSHPRTYPLDIKNSHKTTQGHSTLLKIWSLWLEYSITQLIRQKWWKLQIGIHKILIVYHTQKVW